MVFQCGSYTATQQIAQPVLLPVHLEPPCTMLTSVNGHPYQQSHLHVNLGGTWRGSSLVVPDVPRPNVHGGAPRLRTPGLGPT